MNWFWWILSFAIGYVVRHRDMFRWHHTPSPVERAMKLAQEKREQAEAEKLAKTMKL